MDAKAIGEELVAGCREARQAENLDRLYAAQAVSVEAADMGTGRETRGRDAIREKHAWFDGAFELHSEEAIGPMMHGDDRFAVIFKIDCTNKESGERAMMEEIAVYHVDGGKIVREEFFYS